MTWVQLGIRMSAVFVKSRPDADEIIGEAEAATRTDTGVNSSGFIAGDLVIRAFGRTAMGSIRSIKRAIGLPPCVV